MNQTHFLMMKSQIGQRIKKIRNELKLSQLDFAENLGIDRSHVSKLEKGISEPSDMLIRYIANYYEVNLDWLRDNIGPMWLSPEQTIEEIKKLLDQSEDEAQAGLKNILSLFTDVINYMFDKIYDLNQADILFDKPNKELLNAKKELENSLFHLSESIGFLLKPRKKKGKEAYSKLKKRI